MNRKQRRVAQAENKDEQKCVICRREAVRKAEGSFTRQLLCNVNTALPGLKVCADHKLEIE